MNFQELMKKMVELDQPVQEEKKADKDYDGDGEVESDKDEVWGSRMKAAAKAGKMEGYYKDPDGDDEDAADAADRADDERRSREEELDECGDMMGGMSAPMSAPKQQDSVTMNVSMNGSGSGGIRDLLNVLKDIQDGPSDSMSGDDMDMGPDMDSDTGAGPDVLLKKNIDSMASAIDDDFANSMPGDTGPEIMPAHDSGADLHKQKGAYPKASGGDNAMKLKDGATYKLPAGDIQVKLEGLYREILSRDLTEGSGPKEKAHSKYVDRNSAESKSKVAAAKDKMSKDEKAKPGKALLGKIKAK